MTDPKIPRTPEQEKQLTADQAAREAKQLADNKARHEGTVS